MKKSKTLLVLSCILALLICFPLLLDMFVFGNNLPSNLGNSDWSGFLGSYIGSLVGAFISLIGIVKTIKYASDENKKDRELQVRPYLAIKYERKTELIISKNNLGYLAYNCDENTGNRDMIYGLLTIKNVGLGSAVDCDYEWEPIEDGREHIPVLLVSSTPVEVNSIQPGDEGTFSIRIAMNFETISENMIYPDGPMAHELKLEHTQKYKDFKIILHYYYFDVLRNKYQQTITFKSNNFYRGPNNEHKFGSFGCELNLINVGVSEKCLPSK